LACRAQQLLTESQVFEDEVFPRTKSPDNPSEDIPERHDHGKNLIGTVGIETFAKSLILRVYDLLARHRPSFWKATFGAMFSTENKNRLQRRYWPQMK
jgi:hypothetical protein